MKNNDYISNENTTNENNSQNKKLYSFNKKLAIIKQTYKVSNAQLSKQLNIDASLISRYCTGTRILQSNSPLIDDLSSYIISKSKSGKQKNTLYKILELSNEAGNKQTDEQLKEKLNEWFKEGYDNPDIKAIDTFFRKLSFLHTNTGFKPLTMEQINPNILPKDTIKIYWGTQGMREAVISFLTATINNEKASTLLLYSDQDLSWLTADSKFTMIWASLMYYTLSKKNKIRIVHDINRDLPEMFAGIENWLPFYMTGLIEPYYNKKPKGNRFEHTIFINPDCATISSFGVGNDLENIHYTLNTTREHTLRDAKLYNAMLSSCSPLINIYTPLNTREYIQHLDEFDNKKEDLICLYTSLSIYTMPEKLLYEILDRNSIIDEDKNKIIDYYNNRKNNFLAHIKEHIVKDIIALPKLNDFTLNSISIDIPSCIIGKQIYYTLDEYKQHALYSLDLIKNNHNFSMHILEKNPLSSIQIYQKSNEETFVSINDAPFISFAMNHKLMTTAFTEYLNMLADKSKLINSSNIDYTTNYFDII